MKSEVDKQDAPEFYVELESNFLNSILEKEEGYDYTDLKAFIEEKGLPVLSTELLIDSLHNDKYFNPLFYVS